MQARNSPTFGMLFTDAVGIGPLTDLQQAAFGHARDTALPDWKRTRLAGLDLDALQPAFGAVEIIAPAPSAGVYIADLRTALAERPELLARFAGTAVATKHNRFTALNTALAEDGIVVHVGRNVEVAEPIRVTYRIPEAGVAILPRTLVVAEANSRVTVIEEFTSDVLDGPALVIPVGEIFVGDGAQVQFMSLQTLSLHARLIAAQCAVLERDSTLTWLAGGVGADVQHTEMEVRLEGNGSNLHWLGFTYATGTQNMLWAPKVNHIGLNTTAQIDWKSAVADTGYAVFDGMIKIGKGAQGTNSDLRDNVLHLSPAARSDSIPGLEIDANEVKAGHGSTSGQVDEEQLFYLQARGLNRHDAMHMIVNGFFASIVEQIPVEEVRDRALELIASKL